MNIEQARFNMIQQQIRPWNVLDLDILRLLERVPRERFVPPAQQALAFVDMELPLTAQGACGPCMLAPRVEARMLQDLQLKPSDRVLEIGTGSGYMAALLGERAARVISLEIDPDLAARARANLQAAGVANVDVRVQDGARGLPESGPFDAIVLSGSVAQVPQALLEQLQVNGRLIAIVGDEPMMRATLITRSGPHSFSTQQTWDTCAPRLLNFEETPQFQF
jgi:protein-L-isoaspartate(D-aspartate) O-methyltransferase